MLFPYCLHVGYELCSMRHTASADLRGVVTDLKLLHGTGFMSSAMHIRELVLYRHKDKQSKLTLLKPKLIYAL
jgi:hypothetical protein